MIGVWRCINCALPALSRIQVIPKRLVDAHPMYLAKCQEAKYRILDQRISNPEVYETFKVQLCRILGLIRIGNTGPSLGRRSFIRQSVVSLGVTVQEYMKHSEASPSPKPQPAPTIDRRDWLRPPGAVDESDFLDRCTKCSDCLDACPYDAISHHSQDETPVIFPEIRSLSTLRRLSLHSVRVRQRRFYRWTVTRDIHMGLAVVYSSSVYGGSWM